MVLRTLTIWLGVIFAVQLVALSRVHAQRGSSLTYNADELKQHFQNQAEGYRIVSGKQTLKLQRQPLMHWNNPTRKQEQGALYVWTRNGRPQTLISIFTYEYDDRLHCRHELLSLSDQPLVARLDGQAAWSPAKPGLQWKPVDDVPPPAASAPRRLTQMRGIARQFSGELRITDQQPSQLGLKPQPVIRYDSAKENVVDGAVFSLAVATDPEVWLSIEARTGQRGVKKWYYAAARSHYHELEIKRKEQVVWTAPRVMELQMTQQAQQPFASGGYFIFHPHQPIPDPESLR